MGARVSIRTFGPTAASASAAVQSNEVVMTGSGAGVVNNFVFPVPFITVSNIIVQDLDGVGIEVDEPQSSLTTLGFSVTSYGNGRLVYIVTGTLGPLSGSGVQSNQVTLIGSGAGTVNNILFPIVFSTVSNIIVQDLNGVGIEVDEPQDSLTVTGFSVTAYGNGELVYIVTGTF